ncbi:hypothetical protein VP01_693g3 [Puccinia sorghi]|uniref:Uncharacterized protein n=1 Tax=Puccinia sorghi TaxID=27349 RepID=A0A0L6UEX9_9BASI|nr:hypothetical protein VP01_693g3 [Puccinia sorghi]
MSSQWPMSNQADSHPAVESAPEVSLRRDNNAQEEQEGHGLPDPQIIDLSAGHQSSTADPSVHLRQEILQGLTRDSLLVPGLAPADHLFAYSKAIPTG